jgi:hypothetical protein
MGAMPKALGAMLLTTAALLLVNDVHAASPPRVSGQNCQWLAAEIGATNVWQTTFWGWRYDVFDEREDINVAPCFASEADCKAWLYWAQSDWKHSFYQWPPCQKGVR